MERFSFLGRKDNDSLLQDILRYASTPGLISFAGGVPDPLTLPELEFPDGLQYGKASGLNEIISWASDRNNVDGTGLVTNGSQEAVFLVSALLLEKGDKVLVEDRTYMAALKVFRRFGAIPIPVKTDENGIVPEDLSQKSDQGKFLYIIPDFSNPTGILTTKKRREEIAEISNDSGLLIVEDSAYRELWYDEKPPEPVSSIAENHIFIGSFSKTIAPGLRVGYMIGDKEVVERAVQLKTEMNLHTSETSQSAVVSFLPKFEEHIRKLRKFYKEKRDEMASALSSQGLNFHTPKGGFFFYVDIGKNSTSLLKKAVEAGTAYVPGEFFRLDGINTEIRLSFSQVSKEKIREGISKLVSVINLRF